MNTEWKSIASAPKDESDIWAFNGEQGRMQWSEGDGWALWVWSDPILSDVDPAPDQPTHWMPLPPAPTSHPIPTGATGEDERKAFEAWGLAGCEMVDDPQSMRMDIARHCAWQAWQARASLAAPAAGDALDERQDWIACDMRHRMVTDNLKLSAVEMRAREKRCRNAYTLEYMGAPMRWLADVYAEASAVFEAKLAALAAIAQQKGEA